MGKKSKVQKAKRAQKKREEKRIKRGNKKNVKGVNPIFFSTQSNNLISDDFVNKKDAIVNLFLKYNPQDILTSLTISSLWLPNISSGIKHSLALNLLLSNPIDQFDEKNKIDSYDEFNSFLVKLYDLLPSFPTVEDFIPDPDWGEVKVSFKDDNYKVFYGGSVERITDFIEAFKLKYHEYHNALNDMHIIMQIQNLIISSIAKDIIGSVDHIASGHIEVPSQEFWNNGLNALKQVTVLKDHSTITPELIITFGQVKPFDSYAAIMRAVCESGHGIPAIFINIDNKVYPINFREMASIIIDYWDHKNINIDISQQVSNFIKLNYQSHFLNPFKLISPSLKLVNDFSTIIKDKNKIYLIAVLDAEQFSELEKWETDIIKTLSNDDWFFIEQESRKRGVIANINHEKPKPSQVELIAVVNIDLIPSFPVAIPANSRSFILLFADFITLFSSLQNEAELTSFLSHIDNSFSSMSIAPTGLMDHFAAFRDTDSVLNEGAINYTQLMIDPHWGSNWRYRELSKYWEYAPLYFPRWEKVWQIGNHYDGIVELASRNDSQIAWSTTINNCSIHFLYNFDESLKFGELDCRLINLFCEHIADALSQRRELIKNIDLFQRKNIVISCKINDQYLATMDLTEDIDIEAKTLFSDWNLKNNNEELLEIDVLINNFLIKQALSKPKDASLQTNATISFIQATYSLLNISFNDVELIKEIQETSSRRPRANFHVQVKPFDTADTPPLIPENKHYKLAKKALAFIFKEKGITPSSTYKLDEAKAIINTIAGEFRKNIYEKIQSLNKESLLLFALENHEALVNDDYRRSMLAKQSLNHETTYNVFERASQSKSDFVRQSLNYRYLIECILSIKPENIERNSFSNDSALQLIADIDWLIVLYRASDTLHNDIDIGGITISTDFTPEIFFSNDRKKKEAVFMQEQAKVNLGIDINTSDQIDTPHSDSLIDSLDEAFLNDLGFTYSHLYGVQSVLMAWAQINQIELALSYQASYVEITNICIKELDKTEIHEDEIINIINFLTLDGTKIKKLLGSDREYFDVPISDHNKRDHRYNIRPLILIDNNKIMWGAGAVYRSSMIWLEHTLNGYLPADFNWPTVTPVVEEIKKSIEDNLEEKTLEIIKRVTNCAENVDFKKRFPKEQFNDDGDFDTLAYFPDKNLWLNVECKYNKPKFCLKDFRQLRETIFGKPNKNRGQIGKIERRYDFLNNNLDKVRNLLNWPLPSPDIKPTIINVYVSKDIYWWFRNPPYEVDINFVQVDALQFWLDSHIV